MSLSELALLANIVMPLVTLLVGAGQIAVVWWGITQMIKSNEDRAAGAKEASRQADQRHQEAMERMEKQHREAMAKHEATMEQLRQQGEALKTLIERNR